MAGYRPADEGIVKSKHSIGLRAIALGATLFVLSGASLARAEVKVPKVLSDHAILQREVPLHIWGWANPGEQVTVSLHDQKQSATTGSAGKWSLQLRPEHAGGPYKLVIQGSNTVTLSDILVGDVWFASGQSNMEFPMFGTPGWKDGSATGQADQPQIRLLRVSRRLSEQPQSDQDASWTPCVRQTLSSFSAVAFYFGLELQQHEKVPIGLIDDSWGNTPAEAFMSMGSLSNPAFSPIFNDWPRSPAEIGAIVATHKQEDDAAKASNAPPPKRPYPDSWAPSFVYNGMIAPFTDYTIKGVLFYQGEANTRWSRASMYSTIFPLLISDWRGRWQQPEMPFLFAQISSFKSTRFEVWGIVRDAQRRALSVPATAMAVTLDVGDPDNIHPANKQPVGHRLALAALSVAYGQRLEATGPLFREAVPQGQGLLVSFDHAEGLNARGGELQGFELAGADHNFSRATAKIAGSSVLVSGVAGVPKFVRYAWANAPAGNLYNGAGLPASTFSSENAVDAGRVPTK